MAKQSAIQKNRTRAKLIEKYQQKRSELRKAIHNRELPVDERFKLVMKLHKLPRNGAAIRYRNRCELTGRPRGFYREFGVSRIAIRELGLSRQLPGVIKSSW